jgi:hypothetical protein
VAPEGGVVLLLMSMMWALQVLQALLQLSKVLRLVHSAVSA